MIGTYHSHLRIDIPINHKGAYVEKEIFNDDVWIETRVIILHGEKIGSHCIIASDAIVTKSFEDYSVIGVVPS
jgi:maltose O-acetyltransferase